MKLKWGKEKIKGFSSPVKKAEEVNDWAWWALFVVLIVMVIAVVFKVMEFRIGMIILEVLK